MMNEKSVREATESAYPSVAWRKSSHSGNGGGQCVEVGFLRNLALVRDSKAPSGPVLGLQFEDWTNMINRVRSGEFDLS
jgi:hypothetical protein